MLILDARDVKKYYGDRLIISFDNLKIQKGDKIGIVGKNGAGKTTLLNILAGEIEIDEGVINTYCDISYIKQFSEKDINADIKLLKEFGVDDKLNCDSLSGGEIIRLKIANELSKNNIIILADEPTSNLDCKGIKLLSEKLLQIDTLLLVSHDINLLNQLCNRIIEIMDGKLSFYKGNFSTYQEQKRLETQRAWFEYEKYINKKRNLEQAVKDRERRSNNIKKAPKRMGNSEARLHKGKTSEKKKKIDSAANIIKKRIKMLEKKEKPEEEKIIKLDFSLTNPPKNKIIISCENLNFNYGKKCIFNKANFKVLNNSKIAIIGDNGAGKTTLLNIIKNKEKSINVVPKAVLGYLYQNFENLDYKKTVLENIMKDSIQTETTARTILARLLITNNVYKKVEVLSGGERIKLSLAKLFVSNANVLMLDEPTNYLDIQSIEALKSILCEYEGTVLFASHDSAFVNKIADRLLILEDRNITEYEGNLKSYEESKMKNKEINNTEILLSMRLANILSKLSLPNCEKEVLEAEYQNVLEQLKSYRK